MVAAADNTVVAPSSGTVSELLKRWFENSSADFSSSTALEATKFMRQYIEPGLGQFPVGRLRTEDIDRGREGLQPLLDVVFRRRSPFGNRRGNLPRE